MKIFKFYLCSFIFLGIIFNLLIDDLYSQNLELLIKYADTYQFDKLRAAIDNLSGEEKETAAALYLKALIEKDAEKALVMYNIVIEKDSKSLTAVKSLWRVAQYYYIKGLYVKSSEILHRIIDDFPNSLYVKKAGEQLKLIRNVYGNKVKPASAPPEETSKPDEKPSKATRIIREKPAARTGKYVIQFGAFSSKNNAERRADYLIKNGYKNVTINAVVVKGRRQYRVWLGSFNDIDTAKRNGEIIKRKLKINYVPVQIR